MKQVLILNAGSSTLKWVVLDATNSSVRARGVTDWSPANSSAHMNALSSALKEVGDVAAVGHRVVHGGTRFTDAVIIASEVKAAIAHLSDLAPLHNPAALAGMEASAQLFPEAPQVAAFDTAFHA